MDESDTDTSGEELVNRLRTLFIAHSLWTGNNNEEQLLNKLKGLVTNIKWSPADVTELFVALLQRFESTTKDRSNLLSWLLKMLHCIEINFTTPSWTKGKTLINLVRDETVTDENLKKCLAADTEKKLDEILDEIRQKKQNQVDEQLLENVRDIVSSVVQDLRSHNDGSQRTGLKKDLLKLCQVVEKIHYRPRLTQMVSWCIMALSKTGRLIQVGTGEGKSCIVAMFAAYRAMRGESVDILTSSSVLAERDLRDWQPFYQALNVSVDCNTNKQDKGQLKKVYECQVVYGTADKFAGDWLCQLFERVDVFGKRQFQCAIMDEVDSLMLDKGHHVVYISSEMPALQHLNPLLAFIWATANQYSKIGTGTTVGPKSPFPHVVLKNITKGKDIDQFTILQMAEDTGILAKGSVKDLRKNLSLLPEKTKGVTVNQLAEFFKTVGRRFPSCQFVLHCMNNGSVEELNKGPQIEMAERQRVPLLLSNGGFCQYMYTNRESMLSDAEAEIKRALHFTPCEIRKDRTTCYVPGFLSELVNSNLKVWIENAFKAQTMTMGDEYIIEKHGIVPVDYSSTGVVQNFRILSGGLQQFLEIKHQFKLSDLTAITNYMSNVGLFLKYGNQIFGISGTLGQQAETETLQKIYGDITVCQIPLFKRRKLFEVEGVIVDSEKKWIEKICHVVTANTSHTPYRAQRAVLIICETINRAKIVNRALRDKVLNKKLYISNNMDNSEVLKVLQPGDVIVATNLAGRGTDLQVSEEVQKAGGLFVVLTFLSENARVEEQAFGRTARQGSPGSAQLIVCSSHLPEPLKLLVLLGKLQSLVENMTKFMQVYQDRFVAQFRLYHKYHRDDISQSLLLTLSHILTKTSDSAIKTAKKARDLFATQRLTSFSQWDIPNIKKREELFDEYLCIQDELYKSSNNSPSHSDLSALNEFWGMWLLTYFSEKESIEDLKTKLTKDLRMAREKLEQSESPSPNREKLEQSESPSPNREKLKQRESPSSNLHHYTAFGNELCKKGHLAESIKMYTKAIQQDHGWAAIAYYNRAFTSLTQQDKHQHPHCISQALEDLQNALKSVELYCDQIEVTCRYSKQPIKDPRSDAITRFDSHMKTRQDVLLFFKANINEAIQKVDRARELGGFVKVEKSLVHFMVPPVRFLDFLVLSTQAVTLIRSRDPLKIHQFNTHSFCDILHELRSLETLGLTHVYTLDTMFSLGGFLSKIHRIINGARD